jgi:hypothetical protein
MPEIAQKIVNYLSLILKVGGPVTQVSTLAFSTIWLYSTVLQLNPKAKIAVDVFSAIVEVLRLFFAVVILSCNSDHHVMTGNSESKYQGQEDQRPPNRPARHVFTGHRYAENPGQITDRKSEKSLQWDFRANYRVWAVYSFVCFS